MKTVYEDNIYPQSRILDNENSHYVVVIDKIRQHFTVDTYSNALTIIDAWHAFDYQIVKNIIKDDILTGDQS